MSVFINALSGLCKEYSLNEKWLISPNVRVGSQIMERMVFSGQNFVNLHVKTIKRLVKDIVDDSKTLHPYEHIQPLHRELLMGELFHRLKEKGQGYLSKLKPGSGLFSHLLSAIEELRKAGINASKMDVNLFEESVKGKEILFLLSEYEKELKSLGLLDYPEALMMAIECINSDTYTLNPDILIIAPADIVAHDFCPLERKFLNTFPVHQQKIISRDDPTSKVFSHGTDLSLLGFLNPSEAPSPKNDGTIKFFRAHGVVNEVKEVFRRILEKKIPFEQVEILYTDTATYVPLILEMSFLYKGEFDHSDEDTENKKEIEQDKDDHSMDEEKQDFSMVTFYEGIPAAFSRPGKALKAWISWITNDFPQYIVRRMIHDGLLNIGDIKESNASFARLAKLFRKIPIGKGRDRYKKGFDVYITGLKKQIAHMKVAEDEDPIEFQKRKKEKEKNCELISKVRELVLTLIENAPQSSDVPQDIIKKMFWFLDEMVRCSGKFNNYVADKLKIEINNLKESSIPEKNFKYFNAWEWLSSLLNEKNLEGEGPRPGSIYVSNISSGGYSGRKYTFLLGLDDSRFPGSGLYDPILLDQERSKLSSDIPQMSDVPGNKLKNLHRLYSRLGGYLTLSYSSLDIPGNRELFPSSAFLSAFRIATGNHEADYEELNKKLSPSASFTPCGEGFSSTIDEWWINMLCGKEKIARVEECIIHTYKNLKQGLYAKKMRASHNFTTYDGYIPGAGNTLDPYHIDGPVLSANRLQICATSPLDYFFKYVLGLEPPEDEEVDVNVWLDHMTRGSLLHSVFEKFMRKLRDENELPSFNHHKDLIHTILEKEIKIKKEEYPPFHTYAFEKDCFLLKKAVDIFLNREEEFCKKSSPLFFEVPIGIPEANLKDGIGDRDPAYLLLPNGKTIRVRARIDRIDKLGKGDKPFYTVWDYKTGSSSSYDKSDPFKKGRIIQNILYLLIAEKQLMEKVDPAARVIEVGYFFTSISALGKRISWDAPVLLEGKEYLEKLADIIAAGCFPCSVDAKDLAYTDYADAMIDVEQTRQEMIIKMNNQDNKTLECMRNLRV